MNPNRPLNRCKINASFVLSKSIHKQLCTKNCLNSFDVLEMFISEVHSMYIYIMHYLNCFRHAQLKT